VSEHDDLRTALEGVLPDGSRAPLARVSEAERRLDRRAVESGKITQQCFRELWGVDFTEVEL
jgi:hypothetical protein